MTINVNAVNDTPVLGNNTFTIAANSPVVINGTNLSATDVDNAASSLIFSVNNVLNGQFELVATPNAAITSFTQAQILAGDVRFVHTGGAAPTFDLSVSDGAALDGPYAANIVFTGGGTPPVPGAGTPLPPPPSTDGTDPGPVAITPPVLPPVLSALPPGLTTAITTDFLRAGSRGDGAEGAQGFVEAAPAGPRIQSAVATPGAAVAPVSDLPTSRATGDVIQTQPLAASIDVEPVRAEMRIDSVRHDLNLNDEETQRLEIALNSARITGLALSVGAVWWAARAAGLVASLLASSPAWRHVDPLPVLGRDEEEEEEAWDDASAEDRERRDDEHRAAWVLEDSKLPS